jgi:hypothetical protein
MQFKKIILLSFCLTQNLSFPSAYFENSLKGQEELSEIFTISFSNSPKNSVIIENSENKVAFRLKSGCSLKKNLEITVRQNDQNYNELKEMLKSSKQKSLQVFFTKQPGQYILTSIETQNEKKQAEENLRADVKYALFNSLQTSFEIVFYEWICLRDMPCCNKMKYENTTLFEARNSISTLKMLFTCSQHHESVKQIPMKSKNIKNKQNKERAFQRIFYFNSF